MKLKYIVETYMTGAGPRTLSEESKPFKDLGEVEQHIKDEIEHSNERPCRTFALEYKIRVEIV